MAASAHFVVTRIAAGLLVLVAVSVLIFAAMNVLPGNAALLTAAGFGESGAAYHKVVRQEEHKLGLDRPVVVRYWTWASGLARGNLGVSLTTQRPVSAVIGPALSNSAILGLFALLIAIPISVVFGVIAGMRAGGRVDYAVSSTALGLVAIPAFVLGALLIALFAFSFNILPAVSAIPAGESPLTDPRLLVLPGLTLALGVGAYGLRFVRASVADVAGSRYVEMARLCGISESRLVVRHVLPNALAPAVQILAAFVGLLVGGSVLVETVFGYPGVGLELAQAVAGRDVTLVEGLTMLVAAGLVVAFILADFALIFLIPRLRSAL
jgi:peptide/nickel transport system permease protein